MTPTNLLLNPPGDRRRVMLGRLAVALNAIGPRGQASISEMFGRFADAADFDLEQAANLVQPVMALAALYEPPAGDAESSRLSLHLGAGGESARRKRALTRLAGQVGASGYRASASISELAGRIADAAEFDFDRAVEHLREVMNLAAQSYVVAAEETADAAAEWPKNGAFATERAAKLAADRETTPVVVRFKDGSYDWFRGNWPIGFMHDNVYVEYAADYYQIVARYVPGRGWKATDR